MQMKKTAPTQKEKNAKLEFISSLEQEVREKLEELLRQKNEFQYLKREKELILEEQRKKRNPNISMFSPIVGAEDGTIEFERYKNELDALEKKIQENASSCDTMMKKIVAIQELRKFVSENC